MVEEKRINGDKPGLDLVLIYLVQNEAMNIGIHNTNIKKDLYYALQPGTRCLDVDYVACLCFIIEVGEEDMSFALVV